MIHPFGGAQIFQPFGGLDFIKKVIDEYVGVNPTWEDRTESPAMLNKSYMCSGGGGVNYCHGTTIYTHKGFSTGSLATGDGFNHATNAVSSLASGSFNRHYLCGIKAVVGGEVRIYFLGGELAGSGAKSECECYRPALNSWLSRASISQAIGAGRCRYMACLDADNGDDIYIGAGLRATVTATSELTRYRCSTNTWHTTNPYTGAALPALPISGEVTGHAILAIWEKKMYCIEIYGSKRIWIYDMEVGSSFVLQGATHPADNFGCGIHQDGPFLYFFGNANTSNVCRRLDLRTLTYTTINSLIRGVYYGWFGRCDDGVFLSRQGFNASNVIDNEVQVGLV